MSCALSVPGMPSGSSEIERVPRELPGSYKRSHVQAQSGRGMETGEDTLTFACMCTRNGIGPGGGPGKLLADTDWFAADEGGAVTAVP